MLTLNQFLTETVISTIRQNMIHLQDMKPEEFVNWINSVKAVGGILKNYKTVCKIDGLGARFGVARDGRPFFEGSRTGPIFDRGAFSAHAISRNSSEEIVTRAKHYDNMLEIITTSEFIKVIPSSTKVVCEIFYNPMSVEDETGITFVTVKYDKKKLGSLMSIMPYTVIDATSGKEHSKKDEILDNLYKKSNDRIRIIDPNLTMGSINITAVVDIITTLKDNALSIVKSRKNIDKPEKANILAVIQKAKNDLAQILLDHPEIVDKFKLGPNIEGIVVHINGTPYKITTNEFKTSKQK